MKAFLFTGGLTDPRKTDFHFEYMGQDKRNHRYFPDFALVKKTGEFYFVEVKAENESGDKTVEAKQKAVERLQNLQPDKFKYHVVYTLAIKTSAEKLKQMRRKTFRAVIVLQSIATAPSAGRASINRINIHSAMSKLDFPVRASNPRKP